MFRLNTKQLLGQHIPLPDFTLLPPWYYLDGFIEPFFMGLMTPFMDSCLCSFLATVEAMYTDAVLHADAFSPRIVEN